MSDLPTTDEHAVADVLELEARKEAPESSLISELLTESGAVAALARRDEKEVLTVRDAKGRLLLELEDDSQKVVLHVPEGDLELRADRGKIRLHGSEGVEIDGPLVSINANRLRQVVGVVETHAQRIIEKAKNSYREVEGVSQVKAKDLRMVAKRTFRTLAGRLRLKAKKDAKIDGEQIYLG